MVTSLGHVGIVCDDFLNMRDFYTRVMGLTVTDESPERSSCFLSDSVQHYPAATPKRHCSRCHHVNGVAEILLLADKIQTAQSYPKSSRQAGSGVLTQVNMGVSRSV